MRSQAFVSPGLDRSPPEPCGLGARLVSTLEATNNLWGEAGVDDVMKRVSADARAGYQRPGEPPRWVPERWFIEWYEALVAGPAEGKIDGLLRFADEVTECGFGRAKRLVISLASPWLICRQAERLWRSEHSHGKVVVARLDASCARISLSEHPFVESEIAAHGIAEAFRYILSLSSAQGATMAHQIDAGVLHATIRWH